MLRITIAESATEQAFLLEGELVGPSVAEAETAWKNRIATGERRRWVVDLSGVTLIDDAGEKLLVKMWGAGAEFAGGGVSVRAQLESLGIAVTKQSHETRKHAGESRFTAPGYTQREAEYCSSGSM